MADHWSWPSLVMVIDGVAWEVVSGGSSPTPPPPTPCRATLETVHFGGKQSTQCIMSGHKRFVSEDLPTTNVCH